LKGGTFETNQKEEGGSNFGNYDDEIKKALEPRGIEWHPKKTTQKKRREGFVYGGGLFAVKNALKVRRGRRGGDNQES